MQPHSDQDITSSYFPQHLLRMLGILNDADHSTILGDSLLQLLHDIT
jgi:hypothetical protein